MFTNFCFGADGNYHFLPVILLMTLAALLGYLLRYWLKPKADNNSYKSNIESNDSTALWESKIKSLQLKMDNALSESNQKISNADLKIKQLQEKLDDANTKAEKYNEMLEYKNKYLQKETEYNQVLKNLSDQQIVNTTMQSDYNKILLKINELESKSASPKIDEIELNNLNIQLSKSREETKHYQNKANENADKIISLLRFETLSKELQNKNEEYRNEISQLKKQLEVASVQPKNINEKVDTNLVMQSSSPSPEPTEEVKSADEDKSMAMATDDIQLIEGIGPKVKELFHKQGLSTWKSIAEKSSDELRANLLQGGERFKILNPNSWPKQARLLMEGKMEEFDAYTKYLIAGVEPNEVIERSAEGRNLPKGVKFDDLKIVEGIGPVIESVFHKAGITTWEALANTSPRKLKMILLAENASKFRMHDTTTWPNQSALAEADQWEELQTLQDNLKGGRVVS